MEKNYNLSLSEFRYMIYSLKNSFVFIISALFLIMTISIFANHWSSGLYEAASYSGSLDYSFALEVICIVLEVLGAVFAGLEVYFWMKQVDDY